MPEHIRALLYILVIAAVAFFILKASFEPLVGGGKNYKTLCIAWFTVTVGAFLVGDFWVAMIISAATAVWAKKRLDDPLSVYAFLLLVVPPFSKELPGFGIARYIIDVNYIIVLGLVLTVPLMWVKNRKPVWAVAPKGSRSRALPLDTGSKALVAYIILTAVLTAMGATITDTIRFVVTSWLTAWVPYYVFVSEAHDIRAIKRVIASFVLGVSVQGCIAVFESTRGWLLYATLDDALGATWPMGGYLGRSDSGLRTSASSGHPIALGYFTMLGCLLFSALGIHDGKGRFRNAALIMCAMGMLAALSRGPWVGAAAGGLVLVVLAKDTSKRLFQVLLMGGIGLGALTFTPYFDRIINLLPFIGATESENVTYRQQLLTISLEVLSRSPWLGVQDYMLNPLMQQLRQGQGIIDMVNTFLGVAMSSGVLGLVLFGSVFLYAGYALFGGLQTGRRLHASNRPVIAALFAAVIAIVITIATTSPIVGIPFVYWMILGLAVATRNIAATENLAVSALRVRDR